ncbi:TRAP transporter small permease subunit [Kinneretia asaccharophila]|uniref:TRAP transporter small permease protein n=1 Tax=Roseateles asaccharophilus TaxID=582607 RepID=A0A4R6N4J0_9BURK|nr:TRAP transporter small permease subunit [Roseateles asaccharophilus]MDN3544507.1 TRAP transporter small permease subunit [Roseateles asaccharophilus]TDP09727.1 TRAP-type mannitol/chloroaromatic compound transport system permease small subunit [Roseateles asaccharophilus]
MQFLLGLSRAVDRFSEWVGQFVRWLVLAAVLISAGNAIMRKAFDISSNAYLEIQWYLFAGVFMLGAGYVFLKNAHVRIDFISSRLSLRTNTIIDILGIVLVIFPLCWMMIELSWPLFRGAWISGEVSSNAGGLIRWPVLLLLPVGFALLVLQSASELIKRIAYLTGHNPHPFPVEQEKSAEEQLLEALQAQAAVQDASKQPQAR